MRTTVRKSDLDILLQVFIPGKFNLFIQDEEKKLNYDEGGASNKSTFNTAAPFSVLAKFSSGNEGIDEYDFVFDFTEDYKSPHVNLKRFHYIKNSDQSMRWVYPESLSSPTFLNFYHASGWRATVIKRGIEKLFNWGIERYVTSGSFSIRHNTTLKLEQCFKGINFDGYSIFMGTVGPNRKVLAELNSNGETTHFVKLAISDTSSKLIESEVKAIERIKQLSLEYMEVPEFINGEQAKYAVYSNIKPQESMHSNVLTDAHFKAMAEYMEKTVTYSTSEASAFRQKLTKTISLLKPDVRIPASTRMIGMLWDIGNGLPEENVPFSLAHMDFTPWNMFVGANTLYVFDWEMSDRKMPMFFDLFHFVFQKNILIERKGLKDIKKELLKAFEHPLLHDIVNRYNINLEICYEYYVLYVVSYYLKIYGKQRVLHKQVQWLFNVWLKALEEIHEKRSGHSQRNVFVHHLMSHMDQYDYSLLKFTGQSLNDLEESSDLDILIRKKDLNDLLEYIQGSPEILKVKKVSKSFMTTLAIFFRDGSFLGIDFIYEFKRKEKFMLSASKILKHQGVNSEGIKVPQRHHDFEYMILFYQLNAASVPEKYVQYFYSLSNHERNAIYNYMRNTYELPASKMEELFEYNPVVAEELNKALDLKTENSGWRKRWNQLHYGVDVILEILNNKGHVITVTGVDGAGKTTVIEELKVIFAKKFRRKVIVLRHRPSLLPILSAWKYGKKEAERRSTATLPRQGQNRSFWSSLLRFAYYYTDYLIGQLYVYCRYVLKGYTVIYDRYYFDFIGDSTRSNIRFNKNFITWLYAFIYKPSLNVLLYAPVDVILSRKQELKEQDIKQLTEEYLSLFSKLSKNSKTTRYLSIENMDKKETIDYIVKEYVHIN